jgi:AcrR family transcriptional regulator
MKFGLMPSVKTQRPREQARKARNDLYRQHILEAAEHAFAERGFDSAKVQDISDRVGLSMGTIYAIFPSKEDLYLALIEERGGRILSLVRDVAARGNGPRDALNALIEAYVGFFVERPNFLRMHLRAGTSWVLRPSPESEKRARLWKEIHELQAGIFRSGVETGVFVDEDPAYLARLFSAMDQVLLADWVENGMKAGRADLVRRLRALVDRAFVA